MKHLLILLLLWMPLAGAHDLQREVAFDPRPGAAVPMDLVLRDETGRNVVLRQFAGRVPIVIVMGYLGCRHLCATVADGVLEALRDAGLRMETDYVPIFISIDGRDETTPAPSRAGWHMLTGARAASQVARAIGFRYFYDDDSGEYAHPAGCVVLTPDGTISSYLTGVRFEREAVKTALRAASEGEAPGLLQRVLLYCLHDPVAGRYSAAIFAGLRIGMSFFACALLFYVWRRR